MASLYHGLTSSRRAHLDGILAYYHEKVPFGVVEVINGNLRAMLRRGRGYGIMSTC